MDEHIFEAHIEGCRTVEEKSTGLEIFNFSVSEFAEDGNHEHG